MLPNRVRPVESASRDARSRSRPDERPRHGRSRRSPTVRPPRGPPRPAPRRRPPGGLVAAPTTRTNSPRAGISPSAAARASSPSGAADDRLVQLRQLAADRARPIGAARRGQVAQGRRHPAGRLVDQRRPVIGRDPSPRGRGGPVPSGAGTPRRSSVGRPRPTRRPRPARPTHPGWAPPARPPRPTGRRVPRPGR